MEKQTIKNAEQNDVYHLMKKANDGVEYKTFESFNRKYELKKEVWIGILNISERTLQRLKKDNKRFEKPQSEKILLIKKLFEKGLDVFGGPDKFLAWINIKNMALNGLKPIELLDNYFGITLVSDELIKIEYGTLA